MRGHLFLWHCSPICREVKESMRGYLFRLLLHQKLRLQSERGSCSQPQLEKHAMKYLAQRRRRSKACKQIVFKIAGGFLSLYSPRCYDKNKHF